jgi:hypothetical protein
VWRITEKGLEEVPETRLKQENLLEENLEDWISCPNPAIPEEPLLIIGSQVIVPDTKDRLELLANAMPGRGIITP